MVKEFTDEELINALVKVLGTLNFSSIDVKYSKHSTDEEREEIANKLKGAYALLNDCVNFITVEQGRRKAEKQIKEWNLNK